MARKFVFKNIKFRLFAILIFAVCTFTGWSLNSNNKSIPTRYLVYLQPEPKTIFQDRDLSVYDFGGQIAHCYNNFSIPAKECQLSEIQAREFIYKHWQQKKRAYIILGCNGHCKEYYVFIEPDINGFWRIVWRAEFSDFERDFSTNILNEDITSVVYKIAKEDEFSSYEVGTKYLSFLDKSGKETHIY